MCTCCPALYQELMGSILYLLSLLLPEKTPGADSLSGQSTSTVFPWAVLKLSSGWWCMSSLWVEPASLRLVQVKLCGCFVHRSRCGKERCRKDRVPLPFVCPAHYGVSDEPLSSTWVLDIQVRKAVPLTIAVRPQNGDHTRSWDSTTKCW